MLRYGHECAESRHDDGISSSYESPYYLIDHKIFANPDYVIRGDFTIRSPTSRRNSAMPPKSGPRYNQFIQSHSVRVIDENSENLGIMRTEDAMKRAQAAGLDLVEVSPNSDPPVAKFLDVGKFKYEAQKKANAARKSQKTQDIKEIKMKPNIDDHDYQVKLKKVIQFIENGDKVKLSLRFKGREMSHQHLGMELLERMHEDTKDIAKVEARPKLEGRQMLMVISPK